MIDRAEYLRAAEIARHTGLSLRTIRRRLSDGSIPSIKFGGSRLVTRANLERLSCAPAPAEEMESADD
jgi:excisionase family DNA binding protein